MPDPVPTDTDPLIAALVAGFDQVAQAVLTAGLVTTLRQPGPSPRHREMWSDTISSLLGRLTYDMPWLTTAATAVEEPDAS
jgi:hypothetical protein